jgi:flagellar biosynthesis protein FlgN
MRSAMSGCEAEGRSHSMDNGIARRNLRPGRNANLVRVAESHLTNNPGRKIPMPSHDPAHCRERLATLMAEQNTQLAALESLLMQEHALLESRNAEGLEAAGTARQDCIAHIVRIDDERRALCRATGRSDDPAGLHSLLAWCDPTGLLMAAMQEYRERTRRCREQNDRNGILVNGRLQGVSSMLNASGGSSQESRTYGPGGDSNPGYGRKLTTRA